MNADTPCGVMGPPTIPDFCPICGNNFDSAPGATGNNPGAGEGNNTPNDFTRGNKGDTVDLDTWLQTISEFAHRGTGSAAGVTTVSNEPVRYFDGSPILKSADLAGDGLVHTRSWSGYEGSFFGFGWETSELPRLINYDSDTRAVISGGGTARLFDYANQQWNARDFTLDTLTVEAGTGDFVFRDTGGNEYHFDSGNTFTGEIEAGTGIVTTAAYVAGTNDLASLTRTKKETSGGTTFVNQESFAYHYNEGAYGVNPDLVTRITLQRRSYQYTGTTDPNPSASTVPWTEVREADYDYYETAWASGDPQLPGRRGDMRTASIADPASAKQVSKINWDSATQTATATATAHGYGVGDTVFISGSGDAAYNGTYVITAATANTFTFKPDAPPTYVADNDPAYTTQTNPPGVYPNSNIRVVKPFDTSFFRYNQEWAVSSNFSRFMSPIRLVVTGDSYARLRAAGINPLDPATTDAAIKPYADHFFRYEGWNDYNSIYGSDSSGPFFKRRFRVIEEAAQGAGCSSCAGGVGSFKFEYTVRTEDEANQTTTAYNVWRNKTIEYLPDTTNADANSDGVIDDNQWADNDYNVVYTNEVGEVMLKVFHERSTGREWATYQNFDDKGRLKFVAEPSAVSGYSESYDDLLNSVSGNYQYLRDSDGLITQYTYAAADSSGISDTVAGDVAGYQQSTAILHGETATLANGRLVPQSEVKYFKHVSGAVTVYPVASETVYANSDGTGARTTTYAYPTWNGARPATMTVSHPVVSAGNNGSGTANTETVTYDADGRVTQSTDAAGFVTAWDYDPATGGLLSVTRDAAEVGQIVQYDLDNLGRPVQATDTELNVTYFRYNDAAHEMRVYPGWVQTGSTYDTTGPVMVYREDKPGSYAETLTFDMSPTTSAAPSGTETISASNLQSLSRDYTNSAGQVISSDRYFSFAGMTYSTAVDIGTLGVNRYRTEFGYNGRGRLSKVKNEAGTIRRVVYDALDRAISEWVGTDDTGATHTDPDGIGSPNNMVQASASVYDGGGVGDGNLTEHTLIPGDGVSLNRTTDYFYDWRDRLVATKSGVETTESTSVNRPIDYATLDNLGNITSVSVYDGDGVPVATTNGVPDAPLSSLLRAKTTVEYDEMNRPFRTKQYSVDGSGNVNGRYLTTQLWFDSRGNVIKSSAPGGEVTKFQYDGLGHLTKALVTDGGGDLDYTHAGNADGDRVVEQVEYAYDNADHVILTTTRQRFHTTTGTGELGTKNTGNFARVSYASTYYDPAYRVTASVNVGTNGGSTYSRPGTVPARSASTLVTSYGYNAAGLQDLETDPRGIQTQRLYDNAGRLTRLTEAYDSTVNGGRPSTANPGVNRRTDYDYRSLDRLFSVTAVLAADASGNPTSFQQTGYEYDPAASSSVNTYDFVTAVDYPDKTTGVAGTALTDKKRITYTLMGDEATIRDPNQSLEYRRLWDAAGRFTESRILSLGSGVDGAVRRKTVAYDGAGRPYLFTSYVGLGTGVANQVQRDFNGFGQVTAEYQDHNGSVNTATSPKVQYAYSEAPQVPGSNPPVYENHSRLNSITYPNGRVLNYSYAGASGLDDQISRVSSLEETVNSVTTPLEAYDYLGLSTIVQRRRPQPGSDLTYYGTGATGDAGDQYAGLDRFGRIVDQWWKKGSTDTDRFKYGYDQDSNRVWKDVVASGAPATADEYYTYDNLNRLTRVNRGTLVSNAIADASATWYQSWTLDALGNWGTFNDNGSSQTRTFNARNQITSISNATTPTYDNNGNTTHDETGKRYVYDAWNRVVGFDANNDGDVLDAGDVVYKYDALDRRISEERVGGTTTHLYYSKDWQVLEERQGSSTTPVAQNVWGLGYVDAMVLRDRDATTGGDLGKTGSGLDERLYVQQDANYNVTSLVNTSAAVVERYQYTPYGSFAVKDSSWVDRGSSSYAWVYLDQGGRYDTYTGNSHFRNRDFDISFGAWNRADPLGYVDGMNLYEGETSNPTSERDPHGLEVISIDANIGFFANLVGWSFTGSFLIGYNEPEGYQFGVSFSDFVGVSTSPCISASLGNTLSFANSIEDLNGDSYVVDLNLPTFSAFGSVANPGTNSEYYSVGGSAGVGVGANAACGVQHTTATTLSVPDWYSQAFYNEITDPTAWIAN